MCQNTIIHCDMCGKNSDGLMLCTYSDGDPDDEYICPDCIKDSGFCMSCGVFSAGIESFDFSDMPGYCENCRDEIRSDFGEDEPENDDPHYYLYQ